jgi:hypothetical protein
VSITKWAVRRQGRHTAFYLALHGEVEVMCDKFCFVINGKRYCICIPRLINPRWKEIIEGPHPEPWIEGFTISPEAIKDLSVLATLNNVGSELKTSGLRKQFDQFMKATIDHLQLPKDVEVHFEQHAMNKG